MAQNKMALKMLKEASAVYPDRFIENYFDMKTGKEIPGKNGDTLALFIGREIVELVDETQTAEENRETIESALTNAAQEFDRVIAHFRGAVQCSDGCGACRQVRA